MKTQKRHDIIIVQLMSKLNVGRKKCPCIEVHKLDGVNDMNGKNKNNNPSEMIIYTTEDGLAKIETTFDGDTVWLSIDQMAELFQRDRSVIGKHVRNIFKEGELQKTAVWAKFAHTAADGKVYDVDYYNLDVIISVGYRVKSQRGVQFRSCWSVSAISVLRKRCFIDRCLKSTRPVLTMIPRRKSPFSFSRKSKTRFIMPFMDKPRRRSFTHAPMRRKNLWD